MDPLSVASAVLAAAQYAHETSVSLHGLIRGLQSQNTNARALKTEVDDLAATLESLLDTIACNPTIDFGALAFPLKRCGHVCDDYGTIVKQCIQRSRENPQLIVCDWTRQKYLQGDINDVTAIIAGYKSTINIALADANL